MSETLITMVVADDEKQAAVNFANKFCGGGTVILEQCLTEKEEVSTVNKAVLSHI